jgi:hypothetical protein
MVDICSPLTNTIDHLSISKVIRRFVMGMSRDCQKNGCGAAWGQRPSFAWLKGHGKGYQMRINRILRVVMESQPPRTARG